MFLWPPQRFIHRRCWMILHVLPTNITWHWNTVIYKNSLCTKSQLQTYRFNRPVLTKLSCSTLSLSLSIKCLLMDLSTPPLHTHTQHWHTHWDTCKHSTHTFTAVPSYWEEDFIEKAEMCPHSFNQQDNEEDRKKERTHLKKRVRYVMKTFG